MRLHMPVQVDKDQRGFTFVELLVVLAVTSIIAATVSMVVFQLLAVNARNSAHMTAVKQVENAVHWISRDASMAQAVTPASGAEEYPEGTGFPLALTWTDWHTGHKHEVIYHLADGNQPSSLNRQVVIKDENGNETFSATTTVARHVVVDPAGTEVSDSGSGDNGGSGGLHLAITFAVDAGWQQASETRVITIHPRSML